MHLFEHLGLVNLQDSHGVQGEGCLARSTYSFGRESGCQLTGLGWETRTVPPIGGASWAQVHRHRSLHLGNARVLPGHSAVEGSEDGGGGRAASGRERGHPRLRQLLMHLQEERHRGTGVCLFMGIVLETLHCKKCNFLLYKLVDKTQKSAEDGCLKMLSWLNFVFYSVPLHHLLTNGSSTVNGCCQNESSKSW